MDDPDWMIYNNQANSSLVPVVLNVDSVPGPPTNVTATAGDARATVSFLPPDSKGGSAIINYTVTYPGGTPVQGSSSPITISGLTDGTPYIFTVTATNGVGPGPGAASNQVTPAGNPTAPTNVTATAGNGQATVSFGAPSSNGGSAITTYTVTYPGGTPVQGSSSPITVSGLTNGTPYTFTVTATNGAGFTGPGADSNQVTPVGNPTAPTNVSATAGNGQASVSFGAPSSDGGSAITTYTVTYPGGTPVQGSSSPITVSGLTNGTPYTFTVTATNGAGFTGPGADSNQVTPIGNPTAPTNVSATAGNGQASVSFLPPSSNGGSTITTYTVTYPGGTPVQGSSSPITVSGLTNGTPYTFTVTATNGAGFTGPGADSNQVTPIGNPTAPTNVAATAGNGQASVSFGAPSSNGGSAITTYTVTYPGGTPVQGSSSPLTVSGLTNGTPYTFTVTATNGAGFTGPGAASNQVTPVGNPTAPTNVSATAGNGQASVSFGAPSSNGGSTITTYTVTYPGGTPVQGSSSPITVSGLTNGTPYTFTVTATNGAGFTGPGAASNQVTPVGNPTAPTNVSATAGNGQASVSFGAPSSNGGSTITTYTVTYPGGTPVQGSSSPLTVSGLTNGSPYTFTVTATNGAGFTGPGAASNQVTPVGNPTAPTNVAATAGNGQASVSFLPPSSNGGSTITTYTVTYPGGTPVQGSSSPLTVSGLTNGTPYTFTVTATNGAGFTGPGAASNQVTPVGNPTAPINVTAAAENDKAVVSFSPPSSNGGSAITTYTVTYSGGTPVQGSSSPITVSGLTNNTPYTFTVTATNGAGFTGPGATSNTVYPGVVPGSPTGVKATAGNGQAKVTFTAPTSKGTSAISSYTVTPSSGGNNGTPVQGSSSPITVSGLTNGQSYTFTVTANNESGPGLPSSASSAVTPVGPPDAPTGVTAQVGNGFITVSFTPGSDGGKTITSYTVTSHPGNNTFTQTSRTFTLKGLTYGIEYTFTVKAKNSLGSSPASSASNQVTFEAAPGKPNQPTVKAGNGNAVVTFSAPSSNGSLITSYTVTVIHGGGTVKTVQGASSPITVSGLTNGTSYTFTVAATNGMGTGSASSPSSAVTPSTVPGAPSITKVTAGSGQATITFLPPPSTGGSAITSYTALSSGGQKASRSLSPITVKGLTNGKSYTFTVTATNKNGPGSASSPSGSVTPE